jgi:hypothetical protein
VNPWCVPNYGQPRRHARCTIIGRHTHRTGEEARREVDPALGGPDPVPQTLAELTGSGRGGAGKVRRKGRKWAVGGGRGHDGGHLVAPSLAAAVGQPGRWRQRPKNSRALVEGRHGRLRVTADVLTQIRLQSRVEVVSNDTLRSHKPTSTITNV